VIAHQKQERAIALDSCWGDRSCWKKSEGRALLMRDGAIDAIGKNKKGNRSFILGDRSSETRKGDRSYLKRISRAITLVRKNQKGNRTYSQSFLGG
jgi:hypothetical protein